MEFVSEKTQQLTNCIWCGYAGVVCRTDRVFNKADDYWIECRRCRMRSPACDSPDLAVDGYNLFVAEYQGSSHADTETTQHQETP